MSKTEIIRRICQLEKDARPKTLSNFSYAELYDYLRYLMKSQSKPSQTITAYSVVS